MSETDQTLTDEEAAEKARAFLAELLEKLGLDVGLELETDGRFLRVNVTGDEAAELLGGDGAAVRSDVIEALQLLTSRSATAGESSQIVVIDANGFRESRLQLLEQPAKRVGDYALSSKLPITLYGMNSFDRRAIHLRLADRKDIVTDSEGHGSLRCLIVKGEE